MDEDIRALERAAESGDIAARARLAQARLRAGISTVYPTVEVNGWTYQDAHPDLVAGIERLRSAAARLGDASRVWVVYGYRDDEVTPSGFMAAGTPTNREQGHIGVTTGKIKVPLLVRNRTSLGGDLISLGSVLEVRETRGTKRVFYRHPEYAPLKWTWEPNSGALLRRDAEYSIDRAMAVAVEGGLKARDVYPLYRLRLEQAGIPGAPSESMREMISTLVGSGFGSLDREREGIAALERIIKLKRRVGDTAQAYMLSGGNWVHSFCFHERTKEIDSPWRGRSINRIRDTWPPRTPCSICFSRTIEPDLHMVVDVTGLPDDGEE